MNNKDEYFKELKEQLVMKTSELKTYIPSRTQIGRLVEAGELISLGSGLYSHPSTDPFTASLIAVARYYPQATISNITALVVHGLSDERIDRIDVDIPRNKSIRNKLICAHRVAPKNIVGVILLRYHGHDIRIYEKERVLSDAYHIDPDGPIFFKALKRYVKSKKIDASRIANYDEILSTNVLRSLRQELADE